MQYGGHYIEEWVTWEEEKMNPALGFPFEEVRDSYRHSRVLMVLGGKGINFQLRQNPR